MEKVQSADGTTIAFDQLGHGPPLILVSGASCDRAIDAPIATELARRFTVLNYDRRGRGDSTDTLPFAVNREIQDLEALLDAAGGTATVVGLSSGAALAAEAAAARLAIDALVMWEPPFSVDPEGAREARQYSTRLGELLAAGARSEALALFMRRVGLPEEMIAGMRQSPYWEVGERLAPTLAYDAAALNDGTIPTERYGRITAPTLVLAGSESPEVMRQAAEAVASTIPGARHEVLEGQTHDVAGDVLTAAVDAFAGGLQ